MEPEPDSDPRRLYALPTPLHEMALRRKGLRGAWLVEKGPRFFLGCVLQPSDLPDKTGPCGNSFRPGFSKGANAGAFPSWASPLPAMPLTSRIPGKMERAGRMS